MSYPTQPSEEPWLVPLPSQPDPAAYLHADQNLLSNQSSVPLLYPSGPTPPPPPIGLPSSPVYFSSLYAPKRRGRGWTIGFLSGILLFALAVMWSGLLGIASPHANHPQATTTLPLLSPTVSGGTTPLPNGLSTPTSHPTGTVSPAGTVTPGTHPTPTPSPMMTPTPLPALTVTLGCFFTKGHKEADFCVDTAAQATLAISVVDCDGITDPQAPTTGTTDADGHYSATWPPRQPNGCASATITVRATLNMQQGTGQGILNFD